MKTAGSTVSGLRCRAEWHFRQTGLVGAFSQMTIATKIALVTGGNKGIGLEICRQLASAGCTVLLGARNTERGLQAVGQLEQAGLHGVHFIELDVTMQRTLQAAAE